MNVAVTRYEVTSCDYHTVGPWRAVNVSSSCFEGLAEQEVEKCEEALTDGSY
jgi:hypothetical protein